MTGMPIRAVGIPWYRREDYPRLLTVLADSGLLPRSFDEWHKRAEETRRKFEAQGAIVERVMIDPDEFPAWCATRGLHVNAQARMEFANQAVADKYRNRS